MATVPLWDGSDGVDDFDAVILGGRFLPGVPTVTCSLASSLDIKKPKGADGASMTDEGLKPAKVQISTVLSTRDELDALQAILADVIPPRKGGPRDPLEIIHPVCNLVGVNSIVVETVDIPQPSAADGWVLSFGCVEWLPAPKPKTRPIGQGVKRAKKKADGAPQACGTLQQENANLRARNAELRGQLAAAEGLLAGGATSQVGNVAALKVLLNENQAALNANTAKLAACQAVSAPSGVAVQNTV